MAAQPRRQPKRKVTWKSMKKNDIKLSAVIEEYLQHHDGRKHSPKTIRWYADILGALNAFLGPNAELGDLSPAAIRAYQSHLRTRRKPDGNPLSDESLHDHARGIRTFLSWLYRGARRQRQLKVVQLSPLFGPTPPSSLQERGP